MGQPVDRLLGEEPTGWLKRLDYKITRWLVLKLDCGSKYVLFTCQGCHRLISGRWPCRRCQNAYIKPRGGNTLDLLLVWLLRR